MVNNGCWEDVGMSSWDDAHACIMHASCNMHVIDMSMTLATGYKIMEE